MTQQEDSKKAEGSFKIKIIVGLVVIACIQIAIYAFLRING
jgi:flagellar basal body-associated protein FliL